MPVSTVYLLTWSVSGVARDKRTPPRSCRRLAVITTCTAVWRSHSQRSHDFYLLYTAVSVASLCCPDKLYLQEFGSPGRSRHFCASVSSPHAMCPFECARVRAVRTFCSAATHAQVLDRPLLEVLLTSSTFSPLIQPPSHISPLLFHSVTSLLPSCSSPPPFWTDSHQRRPLAHLWPN